MKDENDNKTVDWVNASRTKTKTRSMVSMFDDMAFIVSTAVKSNSLVTSKDFQIATGLCVRSAQRHLASLCDAGYLERFGYMPVGYKATEKAKQLFGVQG